MLPTAHAIQWDIRFGNVDRNQMRVAQDLLSRVTAYLFPCLFKLSDTFPTYSSYWSHFLLSTPFNLFQRLRRVSHCTWFLGSPPIYFRVYSSCRSHFLLSTPLILLQHFEARFLTARGFSGHGLFISAFIQLVIGHTFCSRHLSFYYSVCFLTARGSAYFAAFVIASKITPRHSNILYRNHARVSMTEGTTFRLGTNCQQLKYRTYTIE
jgi:hypothetical protein